MRVNVGLLIVRGLAASVVLALRRNPGLSCAAPDTGRRSENRDGGSGGAGHDTCPTTGKEHPDADSLATN